MKEQAVQPRGHVSHVTIDNNPKHLGNPGASQGDENAKRRPRRERGRGNKRKRAEMAAKTTHSPTDQFVAPRFPRTHNFYQPRREEGTYVSQQINDELFTEEAIRKQIEDVRRENDTMSKRIDDLMGCNRDERLERDALAQEFEDAKTKLAVKERRLKEAEEEISRSQYRFERTMKRLEERDTQLTASDERVRVESSQPPQRQPSVAGQRQLQDANNEVRRLQSRLGEAEFSKSHFTQTILKLQADLKTMTGKFEVRTRQLNESSEEIFKEKGLAKEANALCVQLKEELKDIRGKLARKEKMLEAADTELKRFRVGLAKDRVGTTPAPQASYDKKKDVEEVLRKNSELKAANKKMAEELRSKDQEVRAAKDLASTLDIRRNGDAAEINVLRSKIDDLLSNEGKAKKELKKSKEALAAKHKQLKNALSLLSSMNEDDDVDRNTDDRNDDNDDDEDQKIEEPAPKRIKVEEYPDVVMLD